MDPSLVISLLNMLHMAVLALAVMFWLKLMRHIAAKEQAASPETDEMFLSRMALSQGTSEYRLFHAAATTWNVSGPRIEDDFKTFVTEGHMPHYVRDYVRRERKKRLPQSDCGTHCPPPLGTATTP